MPADSTLEELKVQDPANQNYTIITIRGADGSIDAGGHDIPGKLILRDGAGNEGVLLDGEAGSTFLNGNVGIGTSDPQARLDVAGLTQTEDLAVKGTIQNAELETLKGKVETLEEQLVKRIETSGDSLIGFEAERNHSVAGHADRFIHTRSFIPFLISDIVVTYKGRLSLAALFSQTLQSVDPNEVFNAVEIYADQLFELGKAKIEELAQPDSPQYIKFNWTLTSSLMAEAYHRVCETIRPDFDHSLPPQIFASSRRYAGFVPSDLSISGIGPSQIIPVDVNWLGVMFYDRVRFRPAGVVVGDHIYALSLAPGEEVQLTQRSETKRSRSFEEIHDRETERELEFSSTWSTDISQEDSFSESLSFGGNLGANATVPIPETPITAGGDGALNMQEAVETSVNEQRTFAYEVTSRLTSRARQQHKTTFKISTDLTEEFGSRRVLRNPNPTRALTLNFYKLYQKNRAFLERYDAKMCLSLPVLDPCKVPRQELLEGLAKIDPTNPENYICATPLERTRKVISKTHEEPDQLLKEWREYRHEIVPPQDGFILEDYQLAVIEWVVGDHWGFEGEPHTKNVDQFGRWGGTCAWKSGGKPQRLSDKKHTATVKYRSPYANWPGLLPNNIPGLWYTVSATYEITLDWMPKEQLTQEYRDCMDTERQRIMDLCTVEHIMEIFQRVQQSSRELVFEQLFEQHLLFGQYAPGQNGTPGVRDLDDVRNSFDWNEAYIEYLPWWLTEEGRRNYQTIRQVILKLPVDAPMEQLLQPFLTASIARVHLPIKPDREYEAVDMMMKWGIQEEQTSEEEQAYQETIRTRVAEFVAFRESHYGAMGRALPTYDQVMDIGPELATPTGATAWNNDWEKPQRRFDVLDQWSELLPTDGVHVEPALSTGQSADELRAEALVSDLASAADHRNLMTAKAEAMREAVGHEDVSVTVGISDGSG